MQAPQQNFMDRLKIYSKPIFLLGLGAAKSGTTWLYSYLKSQHIVNFIEKESHAWTMFYNPRISKRYYSLIETLENYAIKVEDPIGLRRDKLVLELEKCLQSLRPDKYLSRYYELALKHGKPVGDLCTDYSRLTINQVSEVNTFLSQKFEVKVIFIMRDPAQRLFSQFKHNKRKAIDKLASEDKYSQETLASLVRANFRQLIRSKQSLSTTMRADYKTTLEAINHNFDKSNVKIYFYENLFNQETAADICSYLNVNYAEPSFNKRINKDPFDITLSEEIYYETVDRLKDIYCYVKDYSGKLPEKWGNYDLHL